MSELLSHEIATVDKTEIVHDAVTPMSLLQLAMQQEEKDLDKLTKLMELQERWEANTARKAFNVAFSNFKSEAVRIVKNTSVKQGPLEGTKYANLFDVVNAVVPALSKYGLSHSWKLTKDEKDWMEVTCTIRHVLGHSESVSMGAAPDTGPGRNAIQARGSAKSYLERYTLLAATGTAASDMDNDGNGKPADKKEMPLERFSHNMERIEGAKTLKELQSAYVDAYKESDTYRDEAAKKQFIEAKNARKEALECE